MAVCVGCAQAAGLPFIFIKLPQGEHLVHVLKYKQKNKTGKKLEASAAMATTNVGIHLLNKL